MTLRAYGDTGGERQVLIGERSYPVSGETYDVEVPIAHDFDLGDEPTNVVIGAVQKRAARLPPGATGLPAPAISAITPISPTQVNVESEPVPDAVDYVVGYRVAGGSYEVAPAIDELSQDIDGLVPGTLYDFRMIARDTSDGRTSHPSPMQSLQMPEVSSDPLVVKIDDERFDTSNPDQIKLFIVCGADVPEGEARPVLSAVTRWRVQGSNTWFDHTSQAPYSTHSMRLPAKDAASSGGAATTGPFLTPGDVLEYETTLFDDERVAVTPLRTVTVPGAPVVVPSDSWSFEEGQAAPEGRTWNIIASGDEGWIEESIGSAPGARFATGQKHLGKRAYCHRVLQGDTVDPIGSDSPVFDVDFSAIDRVLLRFRFAATDYSGDDGKHIALLTGFGWIGDNDPKSPFTSSKAHGSTEGAVLNLMHPDAGNVNENGLRGLCTHASRRRSTGYYGEKIGSRTPAHPLGQYITIDLVTHRGGHLIYQDGVKVAESDPSDGGPFNNWNAQRAIAVRHRHMHGGTPSKLKARRDYDEFFGGMFIGVA